MRKNTRRLRFQTGTSPSYSSGLTSKTFQLPFSLNENKDRFRVHNRSRRRKFSGWIGQEAQNAQIIEKFLQIYHWYDNRPKPSGFFIIVMEKTRPGLEIFAKILHLRFLHLKIFLQDFYISRVLHLKIFTSQDLHLKIFTSQDVYISRFLHLRFYICVDWISRIK